MVTFTGWMPYYGLCRLWSAGSPRTQRAQMWYLKISFKRVSVAGFVTCYSFGEYSTDPRLVWPMRPACVRLSWHFKQFRRCL